MKSQYPTDYNPGFLVEHLLHHLQLEDDAALAEHLRLPVTLIEDLRASRVPVSASLVLMLQGATGLSVSELRRAMGDRRTHFRLATQQPYRRRGTAR